MTPATDDDALEAAFEAYLAGRRVPPAGEGLVAFADGVRATAARPPRPSAALADLLATGLLTDQSSATAPRAVRSRRRSTRRMFLAFFAKFAAAGVAAKAAVVGGVLVVGVSTAGFTGALPDGIQHDFASVVDAATPLSAPDPGATVTPALDTTTAPTDQAGDPSGSVTPPATPTGTAGGDATGTSSTTVGTTVTAPTSGGLGPVISGKVDHGSVDGTRVSDLAHTRNDNRRAAASSSAGTGTTTTTDDGGDTATSGSSSDAGAPAGTEDSGSKGSAHGGHGNG